MRRIPLSHRAHIIGFQPIANGVVPHESTLERDFVTLTSFLNPWTSITAQPLTLTFEHEGRARRYTPDYLVRPNARHARLVEVKYEADLNANRQRLQPAFEAARAWAHENQATFEIATERTIRGPVLGNAKWLLPLRRAPLDRKAAVRVLTTVATLGATTIGKVIDAFPQQRSLILATVWRLIAQGQLRVDFARPIALDTEVNLA